PFATVALFERVLGRVADQPARVVHLVHDLVAGVDAGRTVDALDLQAVADVDAGRADLHAQGAVDAVAEPQRRLIRLLRSRAARLAALVVVGHRQRVAVEHHALEARVRTHVLADLLAHEAGIAPGGEAVEQDPERLPRARREAGDLGQELADRREVSDEGDAGP